MSALNFMNIKDANGKWVCINSDDLLSSLCEQNFRVLGMSLDVMTALQQEYQERGGCEPMTPASVKEVFARHWNESTHRMEG